jgi:hypothetical protein
VEIDEYPFAMVLCDASTLAREAVRKILWVRAIFRARGPASQPACRVCLSVCLSCLSVIAPARPLLYVNLLSIAQTRQHKGT